MRNLWDIISYLWKGTDGWFSNFANGVKSFWNRTTGSALTEAENQANAFNAEEAQKQRDWEEEMSNTAFQRQVSDMQAAGVNPALMYGSGASGASTPSGNSASSVAPGTASMSDLMQLLMLPTQKKLMEAQTVKTISESDQIKQIMQFYPRLTEHQISEITSRTGLNLSNISKVDAETAILDFEKVIKSAEANEASAFYKARREYEEAKDDEARASAAASMAQSIWTEYETRYTEEHNGARPSSSSILALVDAITSFLGTDGNEVGSVVTKAVTGVVDKIVPKTKEGKPSTPLKPRGKPFKINGRTISQHWNRFKDYLRFQYHNPGGYYPY